MINLIIELIKLPIVLTIYIVQISFNLATIIISLFRLGKKKSMERKAKEFDRQIAEEERKLQELRTQKNQEWEIDFNEI